MITEDKITEIFCLADDFCKYFSSELKKHQISDGKVHRNKPSRLSDAEVITIPDSFSQQGIQMSQTLLHAVCLQAPYSPIPQDCIIQLICRIAKVRTAASDCIHKRCVAWNLYRH